MRLVHPTEWSRGFPPLPPEWSVRLCLLDNDVQSVQLSFIDFLASRVRTDLSPSPGVDLLSHAELFHHAKVFVCAVRRVARLAESLVAFRSTLPDTQADAIQLAWRKKAAFFAAYTDPRNAIEHIEEELAGRQRFVVMNLSEIGLHVTDDPSHTAPISEEVVKQSVALRNELVSAICGRPPVGR